MLDTDLRHDTQRAGPQLPSLQSKHVYLRPVVSSDYLHLQHAELSGDLAARWRFRGATPSPEEWMTRMWNGVLAQFLVVARETDQPLGLVLIYHADFRDGHASLAVARFAPDERTPLMLLGVGLLLRYAFGCWNFRKLYMETTEFNYAQFASGEGRFFTVEARLREHSYMAGRYWDQLILSITREAWHADCEPLLDGHDVASPRTVWVRLPEFEGQAS